MIDKENRPAYFDLVKIAVGYSFGAMTLQNGDSSVQDGEDSKELDEEG
jgi:hypothetical protein